MIPKISYKEMCFMLRDQRNAKITKMITRRCGIVKPVNTGRKETDNYDYTIDVLK